MTDWKVGDKIKFKDYSDSRLQNDRNAIATVKAVTSAWCDFEFPSGRGSTFFIKGESEFSYAVLWDTDVYKVEVPKKYKPNVEIDLAEEIFGSPIDTILSDLLTEDKIENKGEKTKVPRKKKEITEGSDIPTPVANGFMSLLGEIDQQVSQRINDTIGDQLLDLEQQVNKALEDIDKTRKLEIVFDGKSNIVEGMVHAQFEMLLKVAQMRQNALLVGMAGTGKTHAGSQVAEALGLPFYTMSVGAQTSKSDIIGYMNATGGYVKTHFRDAYEHGGVFLMDEIDAGNANVLIQVNAALSNGLLAFPDEMVKRHKDFVFIASANTYGSGMNRQYVGRNQLDAATLDRFTIVDWGVDPDLEEALSMDNGLWLMAVRGAREYVKQHNIRALITPRATQKGAMLLKSGMDFKTVVSAVMLGTVPEDKHGGFVDHVTSIYNS